jgi:hypothetical protein
VEQSGISQYFLVTEYIEVPVVEIIQEFNCLVPKARRHIYQLLQFLFLFFLLLGIRLFVVSVDFL